MTRCRRRIVRVSLLVLALGTGPCRAQLSPGTGDPGADMAVDVLVLRPLGLVSTVVGATLFTLSLPFTLTSGSAGQAACALVADPLAYTFTRPLGDVENRVAGGDRPFGCGR